MSITLLAAGLTQGLLLIAISPAVIGLVRWLEARLQRRQGQAVVQPYRDLAKLLAKPSVRPLGTSFVFGLTPYVLFAAYGTLAFMIPVFSERTLIRGDLILIIYILGFARFALSLAGLDSGSGFGGLGASREMFFHFLTEVGLALLMVALAILWQTTDLAVILSSPWKSMSPAIVLLAPAMFLLILFETERLPVDNSMTHLELTMSQKAVGLEFSGQDLALIEWAEAIKLTALLALAGQLFVPLPGSFTPLSTAPVPNLLAILGFLVRVFLFIVAVVITETSQPKRRLRNVPRLVMIAIVFIVVAILSALTLPNLRG